MTDHAPEPTPAVERVIDVLIEHRDIVCVTGSPEVVARDILEHALNVEEMAREVFALHRPIINLTVGAHLLARQPRGQHGIVGCSCMDRVFINGQESWDEHLADATSTHLLGGVA